MWIIDLHVKGKIIKLEEEHRKVSLYDFEGGKDFLNRTQTTIAIKGKVSRITLN